MLVNIVVDDNKAKVYLNKLTPRIISAVKKELNHQAQEMSNLMKTQFLTGGPGTNRLRVRSGTLRKSLGVISAQTNWANSRNANSIVAGIHVGGGVPYARVLINKAGTMTTVTGRPWLTVPPDGSPAYTKGGEGRKRYARSIDFPHLVYVQLGGHPALIRGKIGPRGKLVPIRGRPQVVYWLRRSVKVPAKIHPEMIVNLRSKFIYYGVKNAVAKAIGGTP